MANSRFKTTSASDTSIGFDYQFYYYLFLLLDLRHSEKIGIELKDDIHIELADGSLLLIQTKHTVQTARSGEQINLTERDGDLWKTINNWIKIILEESDSEKFISNTSFQLISNKSIGTNPFFVNVIKFQNKEITVVEFNNYLDGLILSTIDDNIKSYISNLRKLNKKVLNNFLLKLKLILNEDDIILKIKRRLLEKIHIPERVDDVYNSLFSELKTKEYLNVKAGQTKTISFEDFNKNFKECFKVGLSNKLPIRDFKPTIPDKYENQLFILQLIDIGDINSNDKDEMIMYTTQMLQLNNNLKKWEDDGDLLLNQLDKFNKESISIWKNSFSSKFREIKNKVQNGINVDESEIKHNALECLDEMRRAILRIDETILTTELSNGHFYLLTEDNSLGWHFNWKNRY